MAGSITSASSDLLTLSSFIYIVVTILAILSIILFIWMMISVIRLRHDVSDLVELEYKKYNENKKQLEKTEEVVDKIVESNPSAD